ncbi:hypothetical protein KKF25_02650 [Patescibacteria group bacterium]|nr:hypothetical protein [Patescibacteria group bacterium]
MSKLVQAIRRSPKIWWYLVNLWTLVVFAAIVLNFVRNGIYDQQMDTLLVIYISLLAIYAGDKEFERWHDNHQSRHPGEIFVFVWTVLMTGLAISQFIFDKTSGLTSDVVAAYIAVLSVLAVTRRSRALYNRRRRSG